MVNVLCFNHYYLPGYKAGGALRTIVNMVEQIGDIVKFNIVSSDRDFNDLEMYDGIRANTWQHVGNAKVYYQVNNPSFISIIKLLRVTEYDVIYLNSFFDYNYSIKVLLALRVLRINIPVILAPRVEFSQGALNIKNFKKNIYTMVAKFLGLYLKIIWQASSHHEKLDIERTGLTDNIVVVPDLPLKPIMSNLVQRFRQKKQGKLKICFISRICKKKNLDFALNILADVRSNIKFDIYGPIEDPKYWAKCKELIANLPSNITLNYYGVLDNNEVADTFRIYDLFLFPTHGENYGHVIIESMSVGTPTLISNTTPWQDLTELNVGFVASLVEKKLFVDYIEKIGNMEMREYKKLRKRVADYANNFINNDYVKQLNIDMFLNLSGNFKI